MNSTERLVIVGGCGHVGLPLGIMLADCGVHVTLLDIDPRRVSQVNSGEMPFMEIGTQPMLSRLIGRSLFAELDANCISDATRRWHSRGSPSQSERDRNLRKHR